MQIFFEIILRPKDSGFNLLRPKVTGERGARDGKIASAAQESENHRGAGCGD
jgi:hypothetical protein